MFSSKQLKLDKKSVRKIYKSAYKSKMPWNQILPHEVYGFLDDYQKATGCEKTIVMANLIPLTGAICGPNTRLTTKENTFTVTLNEFSFLICDPGGGKTNTKERVLHPVFENFKQETGHPLNLENYTLAGLQTHQIRTKGWGMIATDEGQKVMSSWRHKNQNGESETALLCKLWMGHGDEMTIKDGPRGFDRTSMSLCLAIQPQPFMQELPHYLSDDGFLHRFLYFTAKPYIADPTESREFARKLSENNMTDFTDVLNEIRHHHTENDITYTLSEKAQEMFDHIGKTYREYLRNKYNDDSDDSDDEDGYEELTSSKETFHVLKIAAILHILNSGIQCKLSGIPLHIDQEVHETALESAQLLYSIQNKHRFIYTHPLNVHSSRDGVKMMQTFSMKDKVFRAICTSKGPVITLRGNIFAKTATKFYY